jgi:hypothetical protein
MTSARVPRSAYLIASCLAAFLIALSACAAQARPSDEDLLVSPGSSILDGLATMSVGDDVSTLFEAREIFRLAHRDDAVAAIDRHLEALAIARTTNASPPVAATIGDVLRRPASANEPPVTASVAAVGWNGADKAGVERARRWLAEIGCERRGACKLPMAKPWDDPIVAMRGIGAGTGMVVALTCFRARRRLRAALLVTTALVAVIGFIVGGLAAIGGGYVAILAMAVGTHAALPYFAALVACIALLGFFFPRETAPSPPAE